MVSAVVFTALTLLIPTACDVYDSLPPCPRGLNVHFVYDCNMEFADAFSTQVDCLTLLVYDENDRLIHVIGQEGEPLKTGGYHLPIDLPQGKYHLVAFGGLTCNRHSFEMPSTPAMGSHRSDLQVALRQHDACSSALLHPLFHAAAEVTVDGEMYQDVTLHLVKDTNNIRILLQQTDGTPIDAAQFDFCIHDDNSLLDAENNPVPNGGITYRPWTQGATAAAAYRENADIHAAYAEFSTSRLSAETDNSLVIRKHSDDRTIIDLPLSKLLLLLKSEQYGNIDAQEFLDRESDWNLVFFLNDGGLLITTHIIVNGWTIRLNDMEL